MMRNPAPRDNSELEALEQREWRESLDYVIQQGDRGRVQRLLVLAAPSRAHQRRGAAVHAPSRRTSTRSPPTSRRRFPAARRSSAASRAWSAGTRWPWSCAPTARRTASAATSRPTPRRRRSTKSASTTSSAARARRRRRHHLLPGTRLAGHLRARLPRRPASVEKLENFRRELKAGRRPVVVSASVADAGLLGVPDGVDGPRADHGDLPGPLQSLPRRPRSEAAVGRQGVGVPRRRRNRRARSARRDQAGRARKARQPDLGHQLQPAAPRRPGPRQRPDHPGARSDVPRRRLERHQGHLGQRLGSAASRATTTACSPSAWARSSTASIRSTPSNRAPTSASTSSAPIRGCSRWSSTCRTIS